MPTDENLGRIIAGRYRVRRILGAGAHGQVYLAEDLGRGGGHVALKLVEGLVGGAPEDAADDLLRRFRHPRWAAVLDQGARGTASWFQAVHYVRGTSLDQLTDAQPADLVWRLLEDGARVLGALHRQGLIHYDVTPGNVMLSDDGSTPHFVLTDGGLAHLGPVRGVARGTPLYMAPEVTSEEGHDHRADLYALGLVAYRLATGRDPFQGGAGEVLGKRRRQEAPRASTFRADLPQALDDLLADILARDPNARPHDALALLERLDEALPYDVPTFLQAEGVAAAEGGHLVGRRDVLERFDAALSVVRQRLDAGSGRLARARVPLLADPVLILGGSAGVGCTRVAEECFSRARDGNVPVLLMSGRETTGDRRGPLRHLVDGMAALGLGPEDEYREIRLDLGARRGLGREERAHSMTRAVEAFVRGVETTAARTPFALVIEDFGDLPQRAQEATRVLARHLLARRESGGATSAPPVLLMVDIGEQSAESFLVPDSSEPERPVVNLVPLQAEEIAAICAERFPGLEPAPIDLERIAEVSEGLPGTLVSLLAEGCRRGDLREQSGAWNWDVDELPEYDIRRGLSPVHADALSAAGEPIQRLLGYLSLVESPLDAGVVRHLWAKHTITDVPATPLIRTVARGEQTYFTTVNLAVRKAVLAHLPPELRTELATELLAALNEQDSPETALDRARLHVDSGEPGAAIRLIHRHAEGLSDANKAVVQQLLVRCADLCPSDLTTEPVRQMTAELLDQSPAVLGVAKLVASSFFHNSPAQISACTLVVEVMAAARSYQPALELVEHVLTLELRDEDRAQLEAQRARLLFRLHRESEAREATHAAWRHFRHVPSRRGRLASVYAQFLMMEAQSQFLAGNSRRAMLALYAAQRVSRATRSAALRATILNTLGIVAQQRGDMDAAQRHFSRALRLRRLLGDVGRLIGTTLNLGRLHLLNGNLVKGASIFQRASGVAQRFAHHGALAMALRFLAQAYDQQLNPRLASQAYRRVIQLGARTGARLEAVQAAWELAPIEAAIGAPAACRRTLTLSASAARSRLTEYARATHHLTAAIAALHSGKHAKVSMYLKRARRLAAEMFVENAQLTCALSYMIEYGQHPRAHDWTRPPPGNRLRQLAKFAVSASQAARGRSRARLLGELLGLTERAAATASSGRERRLVAEILLGIARQHSPDSAEGMLSLLDRQVAHTGETSLQARALALRSISAKHQPPTIGAQHFSRAIALLDSAVEGDSSGRSPLPDEHIAAVAHHQGHLGLGPGAHANLRSTAHALAHRLLVHHGCTAAPDGRVASALRRVLAATGRMNAGAGLDDLLEGMTRDTIEITGAERACLVLVDVSTDHEMRVATSASAADMEVDVEDLSQTVIQRVIDSRTPLLMHDVFDDEELMGRPSITSLSLRSILCVPMIRSETLFGVLYADSASAAGSFDSVDQEVLLLFAEQAAAALETHRLVADVQNSMHELKAMQERLVKGERLRTMGELSSGVAHEFNNLLTSILARVQLITLGNVGRELKQELDLIEKACMDAAEVVRRLQSYTRQQRQAHFERVDLASVCQDAVEFLRPLWSTRRRHGRTPIQVRLRIEGDLYVWGNPTELREVVTNLLKNALDALADGGVISIRAHRDEDLVHLQVEDDGPGIPEEIQARIFDPFFTTKGERGTGLGLCLSQQIVDRHGGQLALQSRDGEGTIFDIELPAAGTAREPVEADPRDLDAMQPKELILVVDDDENVRRPLCRFLERSGYDVLSAHDGEQAVKAAQEHRPDLVITDVAMPGMDGVEVCRRLKREYPEMPIVLMSGWTSGVDPARARRAGATSLLAKPFALQQVAELLTQITEAAHRYRDARPSDKSS